MPALSVVLTVGDKGSISRRPSLCVPASSPVRRPFGGYVGIGSLSEFLPGLQKSHSCDVKAVVLELPLFHSLIK